MATDKPHCGKSQFSLRDIARAIRDQGESSGRYLDSEGTTQGVGLYDGGFSKSLEQQTATLAAGLDKIASLIEQLGERPVQAPSPQDFVVEVQEEPKADSIGEKMSFCIQWLKENPPESFEKRKWPSGRALQRDVLMNGEEISQRTWNKAKKHVT